MMQAGQIAAFLFKIPFSAENGPLILSGLQM
jgi:hypothetical protein